MNGRGTPPVDIGSRRRGVPWPGLDFAAKLAAISATESERLLEMHARFVGASVCDFWIRQAEVCSTIANRPLGPGWGRLREANTANWARLISSWFHVIAQAQAALLEGAGQALAEQYSAVSRRQPFWAGAGRERRQRSVVIKFPDRRRTTG